MCFASDACTVPKLSTEARTIVEPSGAVLLAVVRQHRLRFADQRGARVVSLAIETIASLYSAAASTG